MPTVRLGNPQALDRGQPLTGERVTTVLVPDSYTAAERLRTVAHTDGLWSCHSAAPRPSWVESDDPELAAALARHFGCPVGEPTDPPPAAPPGPVLPPAATSSA